MNAPVLQLCPAARTVDHELAHMDGRIDWLTRLMPSNLDAVHEGFKASGYSAMPDYTYVHEPDDLEGIRHELFDLPVREIEDDIIRSLMLEKQREVDRQIELVRMRGTDGFVLASIDLFGAVSEQLLHNAREVLEKTPDASQAEASCDAHDIMAAARADMEYYHHQNDRFSYKCILNPLAGTSLYTSEGHLNIACDYTVPPARIDPLINHEIGTHTVTHFNGSQQPLHTLRTGLADYDALQEGLAVLAEYLCGNLPPARLRLLAARVVAADMAVKGELGASVFACLHEEHGLSENSAFDVTARAKRGGGLTKDAVYLAGLIELLAWLASDGDIETLFLGKFAMKQLTPLLELQTRGLLKQPAILPRYLGNDAARARLEKARTLPVWELYQEE